MKITEKQYALALYESVKGKDKKNAKKAIKEFVRVLTLNNCLLKVNKIINAFERLYNLKEGIVKAKVISAKALDKETIKLLNNYIIRLSKAKKVEVDEEIDKSLFGGAILRYGDKVLDGSLKTKVQSLKMELKR